MDTNLPATSSIAGERLTYGLRWTVPMMPAEVAGGDKWPEEGLVKDSVLPDEASDDRVLRRIHSWRNESQSTPSMMSCERSGSKMQRKRQEKLPAPVDTVTRGEEVAYGMDVADRARVGSIRPRTDRPSTRKDIKGGQERRDGADR